MNFVNCVSSWNYKEQNIDMMHGPMNIKLIVLLVVETEWYLLVN